MSNRGYALAIHGGAGVVNGTVSKEDAAVAHAGLRAALQAGQAVLEASGNAMDAVVAAVKVLEDDPYFNAGRGSVLTAAGHVEMDAMVMDGKSAASGAVSGCRTARNPVLLAKAVKDKSPHRFLAGAATDEAAVSWGLDVMPPEYFITAKREAQLRDAGGEIWIDHQMPAPRAANAGAAPAGTGTVGAVAVDRDGHVAAATSTGGLTGKAPGRVGDSPLIGCGTWADDATCAISATGAGETIMRVALAHRIAHFMELQPTCTLQQAVEHGMSGLTRTGGIGGVIAVDSAGNVAMPFNTDGMYRGMVKKVVVEATGNSDVTIETHIF